MTDAGAGPLTGRSAIALAGPIRKREVSSREVVEAHIEVLERALPHVNAVAVELFGQARAQADGADARIADARADERLPPLLGVPCTIKELFNVEGLPHTLGLVARSGVRATTTAPVAQRLLDAGAVLLGLTNTSELALWFETENRLYGRTNNPYDRTRTAGGSSGGCGAAVGCGGSPIGLGSDTGGSIRVPAFCCGVFGYKPSLGLVPHTLEYPIFAGETKRMVTFGVLARRAEDLMPVLEIISGPDGVDPLVGEVELGDPAEVKLDGLRVLISEGASVAGISSELLDARERAGDALAAAGARVERIALPQMPDMLAPLAALSDGGRATLTTVLKQGGVPPIRIRDALWPGGPHTVPLRLWALAEPPMRLVPERRWRRALERGRAFAAKLAATIGDGVLLHPPLPTIAPRHRRTYGRLRFVQPAAIFNLAAIPVTEVPLGRGSRGLPLGVQVAAGPGHDHATVAVALHLERAFGGWIRPQTLA